MIDALLRDSLRGFPMIGSAHAPDPLQTLAELTGMDKEAASETFPELFAGLKTAIAARRNPAAALAMVSGFDIDGNPLDVKTSLLQMFDLLTVCVYRYYREEHPAAMRSTHNEVVRFLSKFAPVALTRINSDVILQHGVNASSLRAGRVK